MNLRTVLKMTLRIIGSFLLLILIYFITAFTLSYIPVNSNFVSCKENSVEIYIKTNGVHTDLVLPIKNDNKDWSINVNPSKTKSGNLEVKFAAFGWGDKGFYLETPTWADLKFSTVFRALFNLGSSAMHVTFYERIRESESCIKICISKDCYKKICRYIETSFVCDEKGNYCQIPNACYGVDDLFYEAKGSYSLFQTCNTWANNGLKAGNLKACLWTPFDKGIFHLYK